MILNGVAIIIVLVRTCRLELSRTCLLDSIIVINLILPDNEEGLNPLSVMNFVLPNLNEEV